METPTKLSKTPSKSTSSGNVKEEMDVYCKLCTGTHKKLVTIENDSSFKRKSSPWTGTSVTEVLECPPTKALFCQYCIKERSIENFLFIEQVTEYRKLVAPKTIKSEALRIYGDFVKKQSIYELNIDQASVYVVERYIHDGNITTNLFDDLLKQIEFLIIDTIMRFLDSDEFLNSLKVVSPQMLKTGSRSSISEFGNYVSGLLGRSPTRKNSKKDLNESKVKPDRNSYRETPVNGGDIKSTDVVPKSPSQPSRFKRLFSVRKKSTDAVFDDVLSGNTSGCSSYMTPTTSEQTSDVSEDEGSSIIKNRGRHSNGSEISEL
jgi:hypothetical protein